MSSQLPPPVRPGWAPFLTQGRRVVLRYAIDPGPQQRGPSRTDALGTIVGLGEESVRVMTRRGEVEVPRARVTAAKEVPPPPQRRPPRAER